MHVNAHLDLDLVAVETEDTVTVMLELQAPTIVEDPANPRPAQTAIVVLDRSGSMSGQRLDAAKRALIDLTTRLDDRDSFGLVAFDNAAQVVVPAGKVGDLGRDRLAELIKGIAPGGSTDLSGGYLRGLQEARRVAGPAGATIILLSDGHANLGVKDPVQLRAIAEKAAADSIVTSTIGIGLGYDQNILAEIAVGGSGNHAFAANADAAAGAVAGEIEGLLNKSVQAASLLVTPTSDVTQIAILNDLPSNAVSSGVMVEIGDFYSGESRRLLVELTIPAMGALGLAQVADLSLTYVELPALEEHTVTLPISVNVVPADLAANRVPTPSVHQEKLLMSAQKAKRKAEEAIASGDMLAAESLLMAASDSFDGYDMYGSAEDIVSEREWLRATSAGLRSWDRDYSTKRLRSDMSRKSRGYRDREQGGEK